MDIEQIWSAALGAMALAVTFLAGGRHRSAWVVGMVSQLGWLGFIVYFGNYGFLVSFLGFSLVYVRNYLAWRTPAVPADGRADGGVGDRAGDGRPAGRETVSAAS